MQFLTERTLHQQKGLSFPWVRAGLKPQLTTALSIQAVMNKRDFCKLKHSYIISQNSEKHIYEHVLFYRCICKRHKKTTTKFEK